MYLVQFYCCDIYFFHYFVKDIFEDILYPGGLMEY